MRKVPYQARLSRYSATDHTKFNKTGDVKHCPAQAICENCMPLPPNGTETCWAVRTPILYKLTGWHKVQNGSHGGQARALTLTAVSPQAHAPMRLHGLTSWDVSEGACMPSPSRGARAKLRRAGLGRALTRPASARRSWR
jgi:hypothetical protein